VSASAARTSAGLSPAALAIVPIAAGVAAEIWLATWLNVNWDEFRFLDLVHAHARGMLDRPLQTFHVHLFAWLPAVPGGEMGQITAGRMVMLACQGATLALIWATGRHLAGAAGATLAALAYLAAEHTLVHGASFRADPLAAALLMLALHAVTVRRLGPVSVAVAAAAAALAGLITLKAVLYAPAFAGAALLRLRATDDRSGTAMRLAATAALAAGLAATLLAWHVAQLDPAPRSAQADASSALRTALLAGLLTRAAELAYWAPRSLLPLALVAAGIAAAVRQGGTRAVALTVFATPLLSVLVYRNAFPYFFPFILPPAMIVASLGGAALARWPAAAAAFIAAATASLAAQALGALPHDQRAQRAVIAAVHAAFPEPVPYIDRAGMIARFPREGFFMSSWGLAKYRRAGEPVFPEIIDRAAPPLVIANVDTLDAALRGGRVRADRALLAADAAMLRETYVPHWGPIWVAGRHLRLGAGERRRVEIRVPGPYTVEADAPVLVDQRRLASGAALDLDRGMHLIEATRSGDVVLRYGRSLPRPEAPPPAGPVFWGFR
jgi:hypothetical protein